MRQTGSLVSSRDQLVVTAAKPVTKPVSSIFQEGSLYVALVCSSAVVLAEAPVFEATAELMPPEFFRKSDCVREKVDRLSPNAASDDATLSRLVAIIKLLPLNPPYPMNPFTIAFDPFAVVIEPAEKKSEIDRVPFPSPTTAPIFMPPTSSLLKVTAAWDLESVTLPPNIVSPIIPPSLS